MKIRYLIVLITMLLFFTGCNKNDRDNSNYSSSTTAVVTSEEGKDDLKDNEEGSSEDMTNSNTKEKVYVTAEEFMQFYSITEEQIPKEYVQQFINYHRITSDQLEIGKIDDLLFDNYAEGETFIYHIGRIFQGPSSEEALADYINKAEVILFDFGMHYGNELAYSESIIIDLREGKIYYNRNNEISDDYTESDMCTNLSEKDMASIREELPKHIEEDKGVTAFGGPDVDYNFMIFMRANDETSKYYDGNQGDEEHFPGFDAYWMGLYKKYFGEEYKFIER